MKTLFVLGGLACALLVVPASAKERNWQTGKVTEISSERFSSNPEIDKGVVYTSQGDAVTYDKGIVYTIQAGEFSFVAVRDEHGGSSPEGSPSECQRCNPIRGHGGNGFLRDG